MAELFKRGEVFWIDYVVGGQRVRKSLKTANERVARDKLKQIDSMSTLGLLHAPSATPVVEFLESYCLHVLASGRNKGPKSDISRLRCFFGPCCPALEYKRHTPAKFRQSPQVDATVVSPILKLRIPLRRLEDITPLMISTFINEQIVEEEWSPATANKYLEILERLFNHAIARHGYRSPNPDYRHPVESLTYYKVADPVITWLKQPDIPVQLAAVAADVTVNAVVATAIYAGPRREEICWLRDEDVDLDRRMIYVHEKTIDGETWVPKTGKNRGIPMSLTLEGILRDYTARRPHPKAGWFFASPDGCRWDPDNLSQQLRQLNQTAGLAWSFLDYRHTFGSQLAMKGVSLFKISEFMGNSIAICKKHYAALLPHELHDDVEFGEDAKRMEVPKRSASDDREDRIR